MPESCAVVLHAKRGSGSAGAGIKRSPHHSLSRSSHRCLSARFVSKIGRPKASACRSWLVSSTLIRTLITGVLSADLVRSGASILEYELHPER